MDKSRFYACLRARSSGVFGTSLSQGQVNGCEALLKEAESEGTPLRFLAYMLATAYHETSATMQPVREIGKGKGKEYGKPINGRTYYGRGYVQLTWLANYQRAAKELAIDLVRYPDDALEPDIAAAIMFRGMTEGWFTGKKLADYINLDKTDYYNARRIVNGTDRAEKIAGYAKAFETALREGGYTSQKPAERPKPPAAPEQLAKPSSAPVSRTVALPDLNPTWPPVPSGSNPLVSFGTFIKTLWKGMFA